MKKKLNAAICALNSQYIHSSLAPWCLAAGAGQYCDEQISAEVIEATINEAPQKVLERIVFRRPQVVGFCCYIWNISAVLTLVPLLKQELGECIVVLGGPEVSYNASEVLHSAPLVDYVLSGEGEQPFAQLLNAIYNNSGFEDVSGLCYRKGDETVISQPHTTCQMPPSPYTEKYFAALNGRIAYLETSRGCPYSCAFCLSGRCGGVRYFDLERAKQELLALANSKTQTVKLVDRTFNANRSRARELFSFIIDHYGREIPWGITFHFEIAGDLLDEQTLALIATAPAGSMQFEIGLQSFNSKTLDAINRKTDLQKLKQNISALIANGNAHIHIDLIAGLPYENIDSFADSFNVAFSLRPHMLQLGFLKLLHGSPMREQPQNFPCEYDRKPPYGVIETPWISKAELEKLHHTEHALDRVYNSGRFHRTVTYLLEHMGKSAFEIFSGFGEFLFQTNQAQKTLDELIAAVYSYFAAQPGLEQTALRDCMICDRLATNASGKIPKALQIQDPRLKVAVKALEHENGRKKAIKRGYALLYGENCLVYVDYEKKNPVTGEYLLNRFPCDLSGGAGGKRARESAI